MDLHRTLVFALLAFVSFGEIAASACETDLLASAPIATERGLWTVAAAVDDKPSRFVLDTGADRTTLSSDGVRRLGLRRDAWVSSMVRGVGGTEWQANAVMRSFDLAGLALRKHGVDQRLTFAVAPMPWLDNASGPIAGLLGADYLSVFDLEINPANRTLSLYATRDCRDRTIPWSVPHVVLRAARPRSTVLLVPVQIDGLVLQAQLDTGASTSVITQRGALRLRITADAPLGSPETGMRGIGHQTIPLRAHRVAKLRFGPVVIYDIDLPIGAPAGGYPFDMLLGRDLLQSAHLWVSYATNQLLVALSGSPPFAKREGSAAAPPSLGRGPG